MREALLQERADGKMKCNVCERRCVIVSGGFGWCRTRENRGGKLVTLIYGAVSSLAANPIEKKPFYHFYPGTFALTAGSWSCNFGCPWCQNWDISHALAVVDEQYQEGAQKRRERTVSKMPPTGMGEYISPERFVELAENHGCQGTSISFNEPTLSLEWSLDVFRLARKRGLYNTYVTNGYMTPEALSLLIDAGMDALNIDVKGDAAAVKKYCKGIDVEKVWTTSKLARSCGIHVEITTLVIPTVNDTDATLREIAERIVTDLGHETPWHVSGYYPAYRFTAPATPIRTLERAWQIGKDAELEFVYIGNVPGHHYDNTYCSACGALLIRRLGFDVLLNAVCGGRCPQCGRLIAGVWSHALVGA